LRNAIKSQSVWKVAAVNELAFLGFLIIQSERIDAEVYRQLAQASKYLIVCLKRGRVNGQDLKPIHKRDSHALPRAIV